MSKKEKKRGGGDQLVLGEAGGYRWGEGEVKGQGEDNKRLR